MHILSSIFSVCYHFLHIYLPSTHHPHFFSKLFDRKFQTWCHIPLYTKSVYSLEVWDIPFTYHRIVLTIEEININVVLTYRPYSNFFHYPNNTFYRKINSQIMYCIQLPHFTSLHYFGDRRRGQLLSVHDVDIFDVYGSVILLEICNLVCLRFPHD